jgi:hypothetical protein
MYAKRRRGLGLVSITIRCSRTVIKPMSRNGNKRQSAKAWRAQRLRKSIALRREDGFPSLVLFQRKSSVRSDIAHLSPEW